MSEGTDTHEHYRGYTVAHRLGEMGGIGVFFSLQALLLWRLGHALGPGQGWLLTSAMLSGLLAADLVSGLVHWGCDTWGSVNMPVVGRWLIRTFREHHVDPKAITRHGFVEANGANATVCVPFLLANCLLTVEAARPWTVWLTLFIVVLTLGTLMTSQIHKWSHMEQPPAFIALLQRWRLILHPAHHDKHHRAPFTSNYCITLGWLNHPLQALGFFARAERLITALTGALPRSEDLGEILAREVQERQQRQLEAEQRAQRAMHAPPPA